MRYALLYALAVVALASLGAQAAPPVITGEPKAIGETCTWVELRVTTDAKSVRYLPLDPGLSVFPADRLKDPLSTFVSAREAKTYRVLVYTGNQDGPSEPFVIAVTFVKPPPGPGPNPDPVIPPAPPVVDPLVKVFADALAADNAPDGRERIRALALAMRDGAKLAQDPTVTTNQVLLLRVSAETVRRVGSSLPKTRAAVGAYFTDGVNTPKFPAGAVELDKALRDRFAAAYNAIASAMEEVGK